MKAKVIAVVNEKGGVGKTTTTLNLAACLRELGKKVLGVDMDPQGNLTICCGNKGKDKNSIPYSLGELIENEIRKKEYDIKDYIKSYKDISYISNNSFMSSVEMSLIAVTEREFVLKEILEPLREEYDNILLDCGPTLGIFMINALVAADSIIIPVEADNFSFAGLEDIIQSVLRTRVRLNPELDIEGILFTKAAESFQITKKYKGLVRETYGDMIPVYDFVIPRLTEVSKALDENQPMIWYKDKKVKQGESIVAHAYRKLAKEVIANGK